MATRDVFVTGGTGYIGSRLVPRLAAAGHRLRVLARPGSAARVPPGAQPVVGNALDARSFAALLQMGETVVHLVGTPHPSPSKAEEFRRVDLPSIQATVQAGISARVGHVVYVSVAQPAPMMKAYLAVRAEGERLIRESGLTATMVRPWYVLGPGHWWPLVLLPAYFLAERWPTTRAGARRLGLVRLPQMVEALARAVEAPPSPGQVRTIEVPEIRAAMK